MLSIPLDSAKLATRLNAAAEASGKVLGVLIEINVGGEKAKTGVAPDSPELSEILNGASGWSNLRIRGLMTVPPYTEDPEGARPYFRRLRELREQLAARNYRDISLNELSMGMSHDFEVAIEEGSTCVRIGTAIFGERPKTVIPVRDTVSGATFQVKVHPRAKKNAITGEIGEALKVALTAPPVEGRANEPASRYSQNF